MAIKTITVTKEAYEALRSLKAPRESFSETIIRVSKRKPLSNFFGILSEEKGRKLENSVYELRKKRNETHRLRIKQIVNKFKEK